MKWKNKLNLIFAICAAIIVFVVIITFVASIRSAYDFTYNKNYTEFDSGWLSEQGEEISLDGISQSCRIHKEIPALTSEAILSFNAKNLDVDVYINDRCIYKLQKTKDTFLHTIFGKTAGSVFVEVPVSKNASGQTLYLDIKNPYANGSSCKIVNMYLGNAGSIVRHNASVQLGSFCFSIIILFVAIVCLILYFPMKRHKMIDRSMLYLSLAAFALGMSTITDNKMLQLVVGHETLYYTISQMFMVIIPAPLLLFFGKLYQNASKKIILSLCIADIVDFIAVFTLNTFGIMDYHDNAFLVLLIFAISVLYIGFLTVKSMILREKNRLFHNIGVISIVVSVLLDMLMTQFNIFSEPSFFTRFGVAGFTCLECTQILFRHIENYQKGIQAQLVSRLAYHDSLTDMQNRTAFTKDIKRLEETKHSNILLAMFDINDLKHVNDNFGHLSGDELIVSVANSLKKAFHDIGTCYRTGGDEFVFISSCPEPEKQFLDAQNTMDSLIKKCDEKLPYPVSVAVGYSLMTEDQQSIKELMKDADEQMYEQKRKMKEARG